MSLQVWLPLNGSLENKGLSDLTFQIVNYNNAIISATTGGKVVSGLYKRTTKETADYIISDKNITLDGDVTMCCWAKVTGVGYAGTANGIFGQHGHLTGGLGITMKDVSSTDLRMSVNTGLYGDSGTSDRTFCTYYGSTNIYNAWHHLCLTYNSSTRQLRMYVDGNLETITGYGSYITLAGNSTVARPIILFAWSTDHLGSDIPYYRPPCELNDVRIYDHCLSPREVKLLAQGLVAHYTLNNAYAEETVNLLNNTWDLTTYRNAPLGAYTGFTNQMNSGPIEIVSFNNQQCLHIHSNGGSNRCYKTFSTLAGKTYTLSVNYYSPVANSGIKIERYGGDYNWNGTSCGYTTPGQWQRLSITLTNTSDTTFYVFAQCNNGTDAYLDNWQIEEKDHATPYINGTRIATNIAYDSSGYGNHGTCSDNFSSNQDSPRYSDCIVFENNKYINCGRGAMVTDALTVNWWGKMNDWSLYSSTPMRALSCTEGGGWNFEPNSGKMCFAMGTGSTSNSYKNAVGTTTFDSVADNSWHMFTGTYDGFATRIYVDGELETTNTAYSSKTPIFYNASNSIFIGAEAGGSATSPSTERFTGKISDVRIYATALSAAAVKELYQSSISFLDNGTLQCSEVVESPTNLKYNQNGIVQANAISEINSINKAKIKTLSDGSLWTRIFYHKNLNGSVLFTSVDEVLSTNSENKFSILGNVYDFKGPDGKYEFLLTFKALNGANTFDNKYNRWKQTNAPQDEWQPNTDAGNGKATGYEAKEISWDTNFWGGLARQNNPSDTNIDPMSACYIDGSVGHGNWFFAIGCSTQWGNGIPGPADSAVDETELWVRIDNLSKVPKIINATKLSMFDKAIQTSQIYEL